MTENDSATALENYIDTHSVDDLLMLISEICEDKAQHIAANWQDFTLAKAWARIAKKIGSVSQHIHT
jgi:hypothetical protein